jgi:hypothetical protein
MVLARPAPDALKEVDRMNSTKLSMTAQAPSRFGMPIYGSAFGMQCATTGAAALATVVRDRHVTGDASVKGDFPGTSAWRPPNC